MMTILKYRVMILLSGLISAPLRVLHPVLTPIGRIIRLGLTRAVLPNLHPSVQLDGRITVTGTSEIEIGQHSRISGDVELGTEKNGRIELGSRVRINRGSTLFAYDSIRVGQDTLIGEFVTIRDANHGIDAGRPVRRQAHRAQAITIGRDVWIGRGTVVLPGVTIGDGTIVGANSVVSRSLEAGMIAVGSPARVIKERPSQPSPLLTAADAALEKYS